MKMKVMQIMLVVAAILAAIGIAVALGRGGIENPKAYAKEYQPSGLMKSFGSLMGPPALSRDEITEAGRVFPSPLRLTPGTNKTFRVAPGNAEQRRARFRISGQSLPLTITYRVPDAQQFNNRSVDDSEWKQREAKERNEVSFVIFNRGGELVFNNQGSNSSTVTIRMEE